MEHPPDLKAAARPRPLTVEAHMGLVYSIAQRHRWALSTSLEMDDLVQAGAIGLMRALETFEPERGFAFSTYAQWWITQSIQREAFNRGRAIRIPVHEHARRRKAGAPLPCATVSLDAPRNLGDASVGTWVDAMPDGSPAPDEKAEERELGECIAAAVARLPARLRALILARFWDDEGLADVGRSFSVSRERARQLEVRALERLRWQLESLVR